MEVVPAAEAAAEIGEREVAAPADPAVLLQEAFARHQPELLGALFHWTGNIEDAGDALQDTFLKCWQHRHELDSLRSLKAWIFQVALNTARDLRGSAWRRRRKGLSQNVEDCLESTMDAPDSHAQRAEEVDRLRQAVTRLKPQEKEVFLLRENGELTYEQIAELIRIPVGTVKTRMRAALARLRVVLGTGG